MTLDKELREHFSDIIYQVDLKQGDSAYIYLLFEHKSYSDPLIALHLLRYMIKIWEQGIKQGKARPFSPIISIKLNSKQRYYLTTKIIQRHSVAITVKSKIENHCRVIWSLV